MDNPVSVSVIGPGALGSAMIDLVNRHPHFILRSVWGRSPDDCYFVDSAVKQQATDRNFPASVEDLGRLLIIAVPDDQISAVVNRLAETDISWNERQVIHLSGSIDSSILLPLADKGASTGSLHPLQTFTKGDSANRFRGIWFSIQGDDSILPMLKSLIKPFDASFKILSSSQKSAMHLAAVFASNYLVSLMDIVDQIAEENNIEGGLEMLEPIVQQTFQNIISKGPGQSLSGPVARGDRSTIEKHMNQLKANAVHNQLYCQLGLVALNIAEESGQLSAVRSKTIRAIFESGIDKDE